MRACLEYMAITEIKTVDDALDVVNAVDHPAGGILVDPFHHERVGHDPDKIREIPTRWLSYAQLMRHARARRNHRPRRLLHRRHRRPARPGRRLACPWRRWLKRSRPICPSASKSAHSITGSVTPIPSSGRERSWHKPGLSLPDSGAVMMTLSAPF